MIKYFILLIAIGFCHSDPVSRQISCYQCNVDPSKRFTQDCSDPYVPTPFDHLLPCPEHEPHHCITAVILCESCFHYNHNGVTVRGCIPSRLRDTYCAESHFLSFPDAKVNCTFCDVDACNHSNFRAEPSCDLVLGLIALVVCFRDIIFAQ